MNLTLEVKELAVEFDMDYVGITPVERLNNAPHGWRPIDILPEAKFVVVMGIRIGQGILNIQARASGDVRVPERYGVYLYQVFGYNILNDKLNLAAWEVAKMLEKQGHITVPIHASPPYERDRIGIFSHRHAAVAAGLGEFGWNNLFLTSDNGPGVRLVSVITTAQLDQDSMYEGPSLCDPTECNMKCVSVCPKNLISKKEIVQFDIGGKIFEYARLEKMDCQSAPCGKCLLFCPLTGHKI